MSTYKLTIELSETIFQQLTALAHQNQSSPESLTLESILSYLSGAEPQETTLQEMQTYSQAQLLKIAQQTVSNSHQSRHESLLERNQNGTITPQERLELQDLRLKADRLMLRKAYAWDILGTRGYPMVIQNFDVLNLSRNGDHKLPPHLKAPSCVLHCGQHGQGSHNEHT